MRCIYRFLRLFWCPHKYETIKKIEIQHFWDEIDKRNGAMMYASHEYHLKCRYCGIIKMKHLSRE